MKHPLILLFAATLIVACRPQQDAFAQKPAPTAPKEQAAPTAPNSPAPITNIGNLIQLETGGCRGYCPIYTLTFRTNGTMDYIGSRNVEKVGNETIKLKASEFSRLKRKVKEVNLWGYQSEIPSTVVDAPTHTYTVYKGLKSHKVKGTAGIPKPILALEALMQDIAEAHGIMVKKGVDPNDPASLKGQVIVQFEPEVNAGNFCMQFMEMKTRPVRRISEDNIWIIGFNPSELTEQQFIDILKGMEGVMKVEPNKPVKERN